MTEGSNNESTQNDKPPSCLDLFYYWRRCSSSISQFRSYYIYGTFQDCSEHMTSFKKCLSYKATKSEQAKLDLMASQAKIKENTKMLLGAKEPIWEFRKQPPADWHQYNDQDDA